jgi:hypothetical protein
MHDFLGLLAKFLILVNHDSLCIYLVKLSHTHNIDVLRQTVYDHKARLEETTILHKN